MNAKVSLSQYNLHMEPIGQVDVKSNHESERFQINLTSSTEIGPRKHNNDLAITESNCFGVIDGSGDTPDAINASRTIKEVILGGMKDKTFTSGVECLAAANELILQAQRECQDIGQGACISFGIPFTEGGKQKLLIVNAGDARANLITSSGDVFQTLDNNLGVRQAITEVNGQKTLSATVATIQEAYAAQAAMDMYSQREGKRDWFGRQIKPDEVTSLRMENRHRVIGEVGNVSGKPDIEPYILEVNKGDTVVFTTDGATQRLSVKTMKDVLSKGGGAKEMLNHNNVKGNPATDNSTVVVARI
jgi:serine/threonine protein phosphatase PrpC